MVRLLSPGADATPTVTGLLTIGKDPLRFVPGAYIQFLRIDGRELTDSIRDHKVIRDDLAWRVTALQFNQHERAVRSDG